MLTVDNEDNVFQPLIDFFAELDEKERMFETLAKSDIRQYQLKALNLTLSHIWNNNAYYRNELVQAGFIEPKLESLEHLAFAPLLHKDVIRGDLKKLLSSEQKDIGQVHVTSGTTGKPIYTLFTLNDQFVYEILPKYEKLFPEREEDIIAVALPYEFALPGLGFQRLYQFAFGSMILSLGKGGYMAPVDKSLELMRECHATVMATTPSYAALLAEESGKLGIDLKRDIGLKRIVLTGEGCSDTFRQRLERLWGCEVSFFYGSTECGVIGIECKEHSGYHVAQGHVMVEIIDPATGEVLEHDEIGEIVVTTLLREGMPMLRYRSGDVGYLQKAACKCGNSMEILHLRGRMENQLYLQGEECSPFFLETFLLEIEDISLWYHFKVTSDEQLIIEVERVNENISDAELIKKIEDHMNERVGIDCSVEVVRDIPRTYGKASRVHFSK
ncbi:AMP-binding protein [Paenibacillus sp. NEAU-GSW1]|nr:AMP-binding protein [Paenibacillus sp. NEAU-GSW1]